MSNPLTCAREGCEETIVSKKSHNQIYCTDECCRLATNKRIMENYYKNKDRLGGKKRICRSCKTTKLSRYNNTDECASCSAKRIEDMNRAVQSMLLKASLSV